jgi:PAS domain S-box-containing protein
LTTNPAPKPKPRDTGPTLLVVDDDVGMVKYIGEVAEVLGFAPRLANSAKELMAMLDDCRPAGIVMDIVMPDMDGVELIQWLAKHTTRSYYYQLRFIGIADHGREIVRVDRIDGAAVASPEQNLQLKGDRNYFREAIKMKRGQVYLSPIDLNREYGRVEVPHRPTLRAAAPVIGSNGKVFGIVVANMDMSVALDTVKASLTASVRTYLVNDDGDFLVHPEATKAFGFDLGHRHRWQDEFPDVKLTGDDGLASEFGQFRAHVIDVPDGAIAAATAIHFDPANPARHLHLVYATDGSLLSALKSDDFLVLVSTIIIVTVLLGLLVSIYLRRMLDPLETLAVAARDIGRGQLDVPLPSTGVNELKTLVDAFEEMIEKLNIRERAPVMMHSIDRTGVIVAVNDFWLQSLGYERKEVIGRRITDFMTAESYHRAVTSELPVFLKTGKVRNISYQMAKCDGGIIDVLLSADAVFDDNARVATSLAVLVDVTQEKRIEAAFMESEQRFRRAFDSAAHGIALVGLEGKWIDANDKFCELLGMTREELLPTNFTAVTHPDDLATDTHLVAELMDGRRSSYQIEKRFVRSDGSIAQAMLSTGLVRDAHDQPAYFVNQIVDLSQLKQVEAQFFQAQKMEAVGNLTGGIAHDFNNILGVILGNLQLLQRRLKSDEKLQAFTDSAIEAVQKGSQLTRQLLAFSRRQDLQPQIIDANELIEHMDQMLRRTIPGTVTITTRLADGLDKVKADPVQLESAILNLAINARDAMPDGGKLIIETSIEDLGPGYTQLNSVSRPGPYVCISVTDTGIGMEPEIAKHVFEPFFTNKEVGKGTGLGLSMVYGFVKQSGGYVSVYSEAGHGTRFRLYLPCVDETGLPQPAKETSAEAPGGKETILLVEDEPDLLMTTALLLEELGYTVLTAPDSPTAINVFEATPGIDLLLTDVIMPGGINGHQLGDRLRSRRPDLPVLLMSGYPGDSFAEGQHFPLVSKPFTDLMLARALRDALDQPRERASTG